jgi:hypothetical protein
MPLLKVKKGDVFSLNLTHGIGLIQCVKESIKTEMEVIRVLPNNYDIVNDVLVNEAILGKELFFVQLPLKFAVKKNMAMPIGNYFIPSVSECPRYFRTTHIVQSEFLGWHIIDSETYNRKLVRELSLEERALSPWGMISIPDIAERIENNWTPLKWT